MQGQKSNVVFLPVEDVARRKVAVLWETLQREARSAIDRDPALARSTNAAVLMHASFGHALSHRLAIKLADHYLDRDELLALIYRAYLERPSLLGAAAADLEAAKTVL